MARYFAIAATTVFLGGYLFGFAMNYFAFGTIWEGVPFGTDATDNKTQILLLYLLFLTLASLGSLTGGKRGRDLYSPRTRGWFGVGAFLLMLLVYFVPHSTQFSPGLTYVVGYSFAALMVLLYLLGYYRTRKEHDY
jgi:hypothetical protein